ncbi:hypothetical protein [Pectinatus sottacetonis]|uniref:hypothetical protein n=1 Tax=Pectinatus sottacetonis TaxID=1002795 RepID=UPI0018C63568|nr:hypothetical protein [Pectinatus sottacetonis]
MTSAQSVQAYDQLHDAYSISSIIHPGRNDITIYTQKFFPTDGSPIYYTFTAYNKNWYCIFNNNSTLKFIINGYTFFPQVRLFSRQIRSFPNDETARRFEFVLSDDMINNINQAQNITIIIPEQNINYSFTYQQIKELKYIITRTHY